MRIEYLKGDLIGLCTFIEDVPNTRSGRTSRRYAKFLCSCGKEFTSQIDSVKREATKSCGCLNDKMRRETGLKKKTHGMSKTKIYTCWQRMKNRCYNKDHKDFENYGSRGIKVCDEWLYSFENFYNDIGQFYIKGLELDRIDVNGNYCKENCRWASEQEQAWNQRIYKNNSTGCAGVTRSSRNKNKFEVRISKDSKEIYIGTFYTLDDAVLARKQAEVDFYGCEMDYKRIGSDIDM